MLFILSRRFHELSEQMAKYTKGSYCQDRFYNPANSLLPLCAESFFSDLRMNVAERLFFLIFDIFVASTARHMIYKSNYIA